MDECFNSNAYLTLPENTAPTLVKHIDRNVPCKLTVLLTNEEIVCTGLGWKVVPRLQECVRHGLAEVVSNSGNKFHQKWGRLSAEPCIRGENNDKVFFCETKSRPMIFDQVKIEKWCREDKGEVPHAHSVWFTWDAMRGFIVIFHQLIKL